MLDGLSVYGNTVQIVGFESLYAMVVAESLHIDKLKGNSSMIVTWSPKKPGNCALLLSFTSGAQACVVYERE